MHSHYVIFNEEMPSKDAPNEINLSDFRWPLVDLLLPVDKPVECTPFLELDNPSPHPLLVVPAPPEPPVPAELPQEPHVNPPAVIEIPLPPPP